MEFKARVEGLDDLQRRFKQAPLMVERYMRRFMKRALPVLEGEVRKRTPVNTGRLRASITHDVQGLGAKMQGVVGSAVKYAPAVEEGTDPHWPPYEAIEYWVRRKLRPPASQLYVVTRGVQQAIARAGTRGAHMFQEALEESQARLGRMWSAIWGEAVEKEL